MYPTHFYDHNGNYIVMGYAGGNGVNLANSSGRIIAIADVRTPSWSNYSYTFSYSNEAIPHLTAIQSNPERHLRRSGAASSLTTKRPFHTPKLMGTGVTKNQHKIEA